MRQLRPLLDRAALREVTQALMTSRLDYCNALYMGLPLRCTRKLQLVQNAAARVIMGATRCSHITPILRELHWLPVAFRVCFKVLTTIFKALHGSGPSYMRDRLLPHTSLRPIRSHREGLLRVPDNADWRHPGEEPSLWRALPFGTTYPLNSGPSPTSASSANV